MWVMSTDATPPAGYVRLISCSIAPRGKTPGSNLVASEDIPHKTSFSTDMVPVDNLRVQTQRLFEAFARCDDAGRAELLKLAEIMAGAGP